MIVRLRKAVWVACCFPLLSLASLTTLSSDSERTASATAIAMVSHGPVRRIEQLAAEELESGRVFPFEMSRIPFSNNGEYAVVELPVGRYRLVEQQTINRWEKGELIFDHYAHREIWSASGDRYEFDVKPGKVNSLGRLLIADTVGEFGVYIRSTKAIDVLEAVSEDLSRDLSAEQRDAWIAPATPSERAWETRFWTSNAYVSDPMVGRNGRTLAGASGGRILIKEADDSWRFLTLGDHRTVLHVDELSDGNFVAAGTESAIWLVDSGGTVTERIDQGDLPDGFYVHINCTSNYACLIGVTEESEVIALYHSDNLLSGKWQKVTDLVRDEDLYRDSNLIQLFGYGDLVLALASNTQLHVISASDGRTERTQLPSNIVDAHINGSSLSILTITGRGSSAYIAELPKETRSSFLDSLNWNNVNTYQAATPVVALADGARFYAINDGGRHVLYREDRNNRIGWSRVAPAPKGKIFVTGLGNVLRVVDSRAGQEAEVWRSTDYGRSWQVDENFHRMTAYK